MGKWDLPAKQGKNAPSWSEEMKGREGKKNSEKKLWGAEKCFGNTMKVEFLNLREGKGTKEGKHNPSLEVQQVARVCVGN